MTYKAGDIVSIPNICGYCGKEHGLRRLVLGEVGDVYFLSEFWRVWEDSCDRILAQVGGTFTDEDGGKYRETWFEPTQKEKRNIYGCTMTAFQLEEQRATIEPYVG